MRPRVARVRDLPIDITPFDGKLARPRAQALLEGKCSFGSSSRSGSRNSTGLIASFPGTAGSTTTAREKTQARHRVCCTNYHVVEGSGYSMVGGQRLDWEDKDVFTVPTWTFYEHVNSGDRPAFLFSFSDAPVMKALSLYRDETRA